MICEAIMSFETTPGIDCICDMLTRRENKWNSEG